jgi:uncharacterized protein (TIGR03067 family)
MRLHALMVLAVGVLLAADSPQGEDAKKELKKLEGTWAMVSGEKAGKPLPEPTLTNAWLVIKGEQHTVQVGDDAFVGTHRLDPTKKPKAIDSTDAEGQFKGKTYLGIYEVDGDQFKVCFAEPGKERPQAFTTKSGTGHILHVWKRQKDK